MREHFRPLDWFVFLVVLCAFGCQSTGTGPASALAAVVIECPEEVRVRVAVIQAFEQEKYQSKTVYGPEMVFERRGSLKDDILHGGWLSSKTVERVRVRVLTVGPTTFRVECNAFTVQYPDDRVMEEEFRIRRAGPYQQVLDQVKRQVDRMQEVEGRKP